MLPVRKIERMRFRANWFREGCDHFTGNQAPAFTDNRARPSGKGFQLALMRCSRWAAGALIDLCLMHTVPTPRNRATCVAAVGSCGDPCGPFFGAIAVASLGTEQANAALGSLIKRVQDIGKDVFSGRHRRLSGICHAGGAF